MRFFEDLYVAYRKFLYYDCAASLTTLSVQVNICAANSMAKCVHSNIVIKIKNESFSIFACRGLYLY